MRWFRQQKKTVAGPVGPLVLKTGFYRSPGFAKLCRELELGPPESILDLGPPSNENVLFLSGFTHNVTIQDFYRGSSKELVELPRTTLPGDVVGAKRAISRIAGRGIDELPPPDAQFDVVLMWDLLHYLDPEHVGKFSERLRRITRRGAWLHLFASAKAPIPSTPIWFKIDRTDRLLYTVEGRATVPSPGWVTRDVERLLGGFAPRRLYQLRNGLQEFLLERC